MQLLAGPPGAVVAAAEGAIGLANSANKARTGPAAALYRLTSHGKDAAKIIQQEKSDGFAHFICFQTKFDYYTGKLDVVEEIPPFHRRADQRFAATAQTM